MLVSVRPRLLTPEEPTSKVGAIVEVGRVDEHDCPAVLRAAQRPERVLNDLVVEDKRQLVLCVLLAVERDLDAGGAGAQVEGGQRADGVRVVVRDERARRVSAELAPRPRARALQAARTRRAARVRPWAPAHSDRTGSGTLRSRLLWAAWR